MKSLIGQAKYAESIGQMELALDLWEKMCARKATASALCSLGRVRWQLGLWRQAEEAFSAALAIKPDFTIAMELMGMLHMQRADVDALTGERTACDWLLKATALAPNARTYTLLAAAHKGCGNEHEARLALEAAIELDPGYEEAYFNLAILDGTDNENARNLLAKAIELDPRFALAHQSLGGIHHKLTDLHAAEYHYRRAVELDPLKVFSRLYLANLLAVKGDDDAAEAEFRAAVALDPDTSRRFFAHFLAFRGRHAESISAESIE